MNVKPPLHQSDIKPLEFTLAVTIGGMGSAVLSALKVSPLVSVGFALIVMLVLAFLRWRIASEYKDYESLEAFAEDIYLLGYLLTLAALLGLAPRLMSDDTNLFSIAGLKLVTTVVGLALMMIFRQTARRWAQEDERVSGNRFIEQQQLFSAAVARLNEGADALTSKLDQVVRHFDPELLVPVALWSNRAAESFGVASESIEKVSATVAETAKSLDAFNYGLNRVRVASTELAGVFTTETGRAAGALATDLAHAGKAASEMGENLTALQPAGLAAQETLVKLATQANIGVTQFNHISLSLDLVAVELGKVDELLKAITAADASDMKTPINRLVGALNASAERTNASIDHLATLQGELHSVRVAGQDLVKSIGADLTKPISDHHQAVERVQQQIMHAAAQLEKVVTHLSAINAAKPPAGEVLVQVLGRLGELQTELSETKIQIKAAGQRVDGYPVIDSKPKSFWHFGGGK